MDGDFLERFHAEAGDVLASIFMHSCDCIKLLTTDGDLEFVSDSARDALGLANAADALGCNWPAMWPESQQPALRDALAQAAKGNNARFEGTLGEGGDARHWEVAVSPVRGAGGGVTHLLAISTEVTAHVLAVHLERERRELAEREVSRTAIISRELRHRLKNQLAVVGAVAKLLARHTGDARELARKLESKLIALAHAQDLLKVNRDSPIDARNAVSQVLAASGAGEKVEIGSIPALPLPDESVQQIALILGELQTNALKHGAMRPEMSGGVQLTGRSESGHLTLRWEEDCGVSVTAVEGGHGGFQLIRRLGAAGGATPIIEWSPTGMAVEFHVRTLGNGSA